MIQSFIVPHNHDDDDDYYLILKKFSQRVVEAIPILNIWANIDNEIKKKYIIQIMSTLAEHT